MGAEPLAITVSESAPTRVAADMLVVPVLDRPELTGVAAELDGALGGLLTRLLQDGELRGKLGKTTLVHAFDELAAGRVLAVGVGSPETIDLDAIRTAAARAAASAASLGVRTLAWALSGELGLADAEQAQAVVDGTVLGSYDPGLWKTVAGERKTPPSRLVLVGPGARRTREAARRAATIAAWTTRCRDLVNAPANELTPERLAEHAAAIARGRAHVRYRALDRAAIARAKMGALLAVAQGSHAEPRLITLEYRPPKAREGVVLGLVGKAVTFDTGGISIKPAARMDEMKTDMAGGAAALCGLAAIAELGLPLQALAVVPATENMPSGHAMRPGDVVTASNGKTIEVTNTDAEGRLILADALVEARRRGATHVLDLATLTGAVVIALGDYYAGLIGNDDVWVNAILAAAETSGDHAWRLPLHDTYKRLIRSPFADMQNSSDARQAGPVYAASFLAEFAGEGPWAHLDIAGTADLGRSREDYLTVKGGTGYGVRLIAALASALASGA